MTLKHDIINKAVIDLREATFQKLRDDAGGDPSTETTCKAVHAGFDLLRLCITALVDISDALYIRRPEA